MIRVRVRVDNTPLWHVLAHAVIVPRKVRDVIVPREVREAIDQGRCVTSATKEGA
jgi:hypothetical protein